MAGLTLVMRSSDSTLWYKDAGSNFHLPVPTKAAKEVSVRGGGGRGRPVVKLLRVDVYVYERGLLIRAIAL